MGQPPPGRAQTVAAPTAPAAGLALADALRRATRLALGAAGLALDGAQALLERSVPAEPVAGATARPAPLPQAVRLLPGVVVGVGMEAQRRSLQGAAALGRALGPFASAAVHAVVARVDLDRVVERLDLDAIVARVDVDAIVGRVDLATVTGRVMDEVDVAGIIRESSSTMASETADALRVQGMQADRVLSRIVDRVLLRKGERQTTLGPAPAVGADR